MFTSFIVSVLVLVAGVFMAGRRPTWASQPATAAAVSDAAARRRTPADLTLAASLDDDDEPSILMDSLRTIGVVRRRVDRPVVGRKAYVRLWERARALVVLAAIIVSIGVLAAGAIGLFFLAAGFLLEQAIG